MENYVGFALEPPGEFKTSMPVLTLPIKSDFLWVGPGHFFFFLSFLCGCNVLSGLGLIGLTHVGGVEL